MKNLPRILFSGLLLIAVAAQSQEEFVEPPSRTLTTIRFIQLTGGVIIVNAKLDDFPDTLNFIMDTGSSGISLDSATVEYFNLKPTPTDRTIRGIAGVKKVGFLYKRKLSFNNYQVTDLDFHVNDYSVLSAVYGIRIDGIIGFAVFNRYILKVNYDSLRIDICSQGTIRYPKGGFLLKPVIGTLPVHRARVKDQGTFDTRFLHDMGAAVCIMLSKDFVEDSGLLRKKRKLYPKEGEGIGGKISMNITILRELKIGPYRFKNIPAYIFEDKFNVTSYPYQGGLIGNDIFRRFNVIFNYEKRDIYLTPNSHFKEPFNYAYVGMEIYTQDEKIFVGGISKGSPADAAGLKDEDIIIAINNDFSQNFDHYKSLLQTENEKLRMIIRRNGELMQIQIKVKKLL